jgi:SAM-dependent methyltransferase
VDPRTRFTDAAGDYARFRPDYPDGVVAACAAYAPLRHGARVLDVGAGTGISSRLFARHGYRVTGVEPNAAMRAQAEAAGGATYLDGDAAHLPVADGSQDLVVAAQALHWFDLAACLPEWRRALGDAGACAAFWNLRRRDGWQAEYEALLERWSTEYADVRKAADDGRDHAAPVRASPDCSDVAEVELSHAQRLDLGGLLGRANSSSYVIHGVRDRPGFEAALTRLFHAHAEGGAVEFRYRTYVLLWRVGRRPRGRGTP